MLPPRPPRRATRATTTPKQSQENDTCDDAPDGGKDDDPLLFVGVVVGVAAKKKESVGCEAGEVGAIGRGLAAGLEGWEIHGDGCGGVDEIGCWGFAFGCEVALPECFWWVEQCD